MEWKVLLSGLVLGLSLSILLALKWGIKVRAASAWGLLAGLAVGVIWSWDWLRGGSGLLLTAGLQTVTFLAATGIAIWFAFNRDPERASPNSPGAIVSPADGTVLYVREIENGDVPVSEKRRSTFRLAELADAELAARGYLVGIGMNLLNVHVNRAPIEGKVMLLKHIKGGFESLRNKDAILRNERLTTVIGNDAVQIAVVQIASRLVRRIVSYLGEGQAVRRGQRIGMIKFGSQVDVVIPDVNGIRIKASPGDEVLAGVSIIAECDPRTCSVSERE